MSEKDYIPIVSVGKYITLEEFKQRYYQPGKVYRINSRLLHKCTGYYKHCPEELFKDENIKGEK